MSVRLLPAYCVALTTAMTSGAVMSRIGRGRTVRACIGFILTGTALLVLCMSMGTWVITAAMCLRSDRHRGRLAARIPVPPRALSYFLTRGACARGARVVALLAPSE